MLLLQVLVFAASAIAWPSNNGWPSKGGLACFTNLVTFGDSYTDESRLGYFITNNGSAPPPGTLLPSSTNTAGGGITWDRWVSIYSGAKLYDYAVSGAVCSSTQIARYLSSIHAPFPGVIEYEVPAFLADVSYVNTSTGTNTLYTDRYDNNTVYSIWIGTNDLGVGALLQDTQLVATNITTFTDCIFQTFDSLYSAGGRYFILMNTAPLQLSPLYAVPSAGGVGNNQYFKNKDSYNLTEISFKMEEYTLTTNQIWKYQVPYELLIAQRYPGASIAIYDVHTLLTDVYNNPSAYLNGSSPANSTGYFHHCNVNGTNCVNENATLDSFMWYDELHPSNRTDQVIAEEFINVVNGNSTYATYWQAGGVGY